MQTSTGESLLDEADFLAELATLEDGLSAERRSPRPVESPNDTAGVQAMFGLPAPVWAPEPVTPAVERDLPLSLVSQVMAAAMFVLMMGVGAAGAALVFHDRVSQLLALW